jgi:hypothetical protein
LGGLAGAVETFEGDEAAGGLTLGEHGLRIAMRGAGYKVQGAR